MPSPTMPHPSPGHHIRDTRFTPCASMPCAAQSPIMRHPKTERDSTLLPAQSQTTPSPPTSSLNISHASLPHQHYSLVLSTIDATSTLLSCVVHHRRQHQHKPAIGGAAAKPDLCRAPAVHCSKVPRQPQVATTFATTASPKRPLNARTASNPSPPHPHEGGEGLVPTQPKDTSSC